MLNPEQLLAVEFGFKCHEKGMNLEATLEEFAKVVQGPMPARKPHQRAGATTSKEDAKRQELRDRVIRERRLSDSEGGV